MPAAVRLDGDGRCLSEVVTAMVRQDPKSEVRDSVQRPAVAALPVRLDHHGPEADLVPMLDEVLVVRRVRGRIIQEVGVVGHDFRIVREEEVHRAHVLHEEVGGRDLVALGFHVTHPHAKLPEDVGLGVVVLRAVGALEGQHRGAAAAAFHELQEAVPSGRVVRHLRAGLCEEQDVAGRDDLPEEVLHDGRLVEPLPLHAALPLDAVPPALQRVLRHLLVAVLLREEPGLLRLAAEVPHALLVAGQREGREVHAAPGQGPGPARLGHGVGGRLQGVQGPLLLPLKVRERIHAAEEARCFRHEARELPHEAERKRLRLPDGGGDGQPPPWPSPPPPIRHRRKG
mmetsp:Transcript_69194/g.202622  ORF Transcript_69194/g.202622 Transcript_69194/m.202622 type:complete len:342 (+) Transcript_69194:134-1159(+)